ELEESFTLERVSKAGAKFDPEKTKWFQQQHLRAVADEDLAQMLIDKFGATADKTKLAKVVHLMKERATFPQDILSEGAYLLERPTAFDGQTVNKKWKEDSSSLMTEWKSKIEEITSFSAAEIETTFKSFITDKGLGIGAVLPLFRLLLTGQGAGPSMFEISEFLGREEVIARIDAGIPAVEALKQ